MTAHSITLSRDNLVQLVLRPDFYTQNPGLEVLQPEIHTCIENFKESGRKAGCGCRADAKHLFECMAHLLELLEGWKQNEPEKLKNFVRYATKINPGPDEQITLSVFFRKSGAEGDVMRHEFKCP